MASLKLKDERGSVLIGGLVLVLVITLVGAAIFGLAVSEPRLVANRQNKGQAVYAAGAGLDIAWLQLSGLTGNTFDTVWSAGAGTNIVGTQNLAPASGGIQPKYQASWCTALYPSSCTSAALPASQFAVRSTGTVVRTSDNATVGQAVVELVFTRTVQNIFTRGIASNTSSLMSGNGGIVDSWDSCQSYTGCTANCSATPPVHCPYSSTAAGTGGDLFSNGTITFQNNDVVNGSISAVGDISLDGSRVGGNVWSGGSNGVNGGTGTTQACGGSSVQICGNVTVGCTAFGSRSCGSSDPVGSFTGTGTVSGYAKSAGAISSTETVTGGKTPSMGNTLAGPTPVTFPMPGDCHVTGTQAGQDGLNRAASGYSSAAYVASILTYGGANLTVSSGQAKSADGKVVYTESTGTFLESGGTVTIASGTAPSVATLCVSSVQVSGGATFTVGSTVTSANPVTLYTTGSTAAPTGCAGVPSGTNCNISASGGSFANATNDASRLQIYSCAQNTSSSQPCYTNNIDIALSGGSGAYLTVYAPAGNVVLSGGSGLAGAVVSNKFFGTGGSDVHYDDALGTSTNCAVCGVTWSKVANSWRATVLP